MANVFSVQLYFPLIELSDEADNEMNAAIKEQCQDRELYEKQINKLENEVKRLNSCLAERLGSLFCSFAKMKLFLLLV